MQGVLEDFCPDVVGSTAHTMHVNRVNDLFAKKKALYPEALTVVGGHHAAIGFEGVPGVAVSERRVKRLKRLDRD